MKRPVTYADRIYVGSIESLQGGVVTMAEPGGSRYARVTVRLDGETYYLANVGHGSITTVVRHRQVRWARDYTYRAEVAEMKAETAPAAEAARLTRYASLCMRISETIDE